MHGRDEAEQREREHEAGQRPHVGKAVPEQIIPEAGEQELGVDAKGAGVGLLEAARGEERQVEGQ